MRGATAVTMRVNLLVASANRGCCVMCVSGVSVSTNAADAASPGTHSIITTLAA